MNSGAGILSGGVRLLRPGEQVGWGAGYLEFPAPGEYPIHVTIKAENLQEPVVEDVVVSVDAPRPMNS